MARQTSLITFTGKIGNMIGYQRKDKHFLRSAPETVRQTENTRHAAQRFGIASRKGALIRHALYEQMDILPDGTHVNRLNRAFIRNGRNYEAALRGFRFNQHAGIDRFFATVPACSPEGLVHIPAQILPAIKDCIAFELKAIAANVSFATQRIIHSSTTGMMLTPGEYFAGTTLQVDQSSTGVLVITVQVRAFRHGVPSCDRKYVAADIIAVITPERGSTFHKVAHVQQLISYKLPALISADAGLHQSPVFMQRE